MVHPVCSEQNDVSVLRGNGDTQPPFQHKAEQQAREARVLYTALLSSQPSQQAFTTCLLTLSIPQHRFILYLLFVFYLFLLFIYSTYLSISIYYLFTLNPTHIEPIRHFVKRLGHGVRGHLSALVLLLHDARVCYLDRVHLSGGCGRHAALSFPFGVLVRSLLLLVSRTPDQDVI